ncbi:hypothetical protein [Pseudomonas aeruginosa]|uniref:Uncharacterized protein n=1 Tax=Pseudomonas phage vB_PaeM_PS119XW TaxID=2601632 RepID=A0A5C1K6U1_9CAUD|nr:hypothetical protein [Pseudomonas aeruginosa]YP_010660869.1 hypothetical protein PP933_gp129 [Pseudomonas phage vB_PaeM_PS119XW]MBW6072195.1 hypothetical protein [Pseudomonas aeruginosa]QBX32285.1 hypothetical protein [Pseudomonas phage PA1C]QEM41858.1 hypothetical protein [Pseudomonas phage vB_PaeM_PS119XW]
MIINASLNRAMFSTQTNEAAELLLLSYLRTSPDAAATEDNATKRILAAKDNLVALWKNGCRFVIDDDHRWIISEFGNAIRIAYQGRIRGSWTTFGINLVDINNGEAVLNVIRARLRTGYPADELQPGSNIKGHLYEDYKVNGSGMWAVGRIILGLQPNGVFLWATLERLYEVAKYHKLYADIVDDFGINHDRDYLNNIVDGKWVVNEANAKAVLNSYFVSMLKFFYERGFYYQDTIDGGRIDIRSNVGSYHFDGKNATAHTINITYLSENSYEVRDNEWEFCWDCNNTEYFPLEAPVEALTAFQTRVDKEHIYMATGRGYKLEDIHNIQRTKREPTEWEQGK